MKRFYEVYKDDSILQQLVAEIPWGLNIENQYSSSERSESRSKIEVLDANAPPARFCSNDISFHFKIAGQLPIGIILCADRNNFEVEYALRGIQKPMGVAAYCLTNKLPKSLAGKLPDADKFKQKIINELGK